VIDAFFPQLIQIENRPAIPAHDLPARTHLQSIANAIFHFAMVEQGGSSLYDAMALKVSDETVLRIVTSIWPSRSVPLCYLARWSWQCRAGEF
jgi:hypothetical protein